jgi:hypothetical protein
LPQSPPQSFPSLQGFEFSVSFSQHELFPFSFSLSFLQQFSLPPQAKAVLVGAATKASIKATGSNMEVKNFIPSITSFCLILFLAALPPQNRRQSRQKYNLFYIYFTALGFILFIYCFIFILTNGS